MQSQRALYLRFYPEMIKICFRYALDADGAGTIYNNAMLKVFSNIHTYKDEGKLGGWIKVIVVNCCIDFCKRKNIFKNAVSTDVFEQVAVDPAVYDKVAYQEIQRLLSRLPGATATVFNLFVYEGLTHKQIAEHLNISEGTSKWHVSEAKKMLKKILQTTSETEFFHHEH
ncbi:MAG: hypothetical protein RLY16_339 [Bacteroidota bacterium]|jgi:RNA polymerase sigma-70 factor (ECF subfamily)